MSKVAILNGKLHRISILQDQDPSNPREDDNVGKMVCWHRRYNLGDEQPKSSAGDYRKALACGFDVKLEASLERLDEKYGRSYYQLTGPAGHRQWREDYAQAIEQAVNDVLVKHIVELPLYLYDHSGITIRTGSFSCGWDSGQVGFIYIDREKIQKEWGWKKLTQARREKLYSFLKSEVKEYDDYLTGNMYGFKHETAPFPDDYEVLSLLPELQALPILERNVDFDDLDWNDSDSCWGFYGSDIATNGILEHLPKELEGLARAVA